MANYRRPPFYFIDNAHLSLSLVFYEGIPPVFNRYSWGFRQLSFMNKEYWGVSCDRWALDTPWVSLFIEAWLLRRKKR